MPKEGRRDGSASGRDQCQGRIRGMGVEPGEGGAKGERSSRVCNGVTEWESRRSESEEERAKRRTGGQQGETGGKREKRRQGEREGQGNRGK